ncbi:hypothetical protein QA648_36195 (plasmid) [Rhizobium sp. CB3171]|uniref:hypothetical protein n=1 Tax=Rhizobium sp. CB3171 TaxID=3039157 RepID=UPI0024B16B7E|nr:hypothetical protein [Rhizobium sp. CB3171]WFU07325.1 hypothetical protein QA648_36195 [Rhizobium sp. CB3171]
MKQTSVLLAVTLALNAGIFHGAFAQDGYKLPLKLTTKDAAQDPDGVWTDSDLADARQMAGTANIYTARVATPSGTWLLTQTNGDCNLQGMCTALLVLLKPGATPVNMANPQMPLGGTAILSADLKNLTTSEISENGKAFTGSYDVGPIK